MTSVSFNPLTSSSTSDDDHQNHLFMSPNSTLENGGVVLHGGSSNSMEDGHNLGGREEEEISRRGEYEESAKWMSSKMRLMRKMMTPNTANPPKPSNNINNTPTFQTHDHHKFQTTPSSHHRITTTATRVCADCNTTTTPLWRGGPKGPKSLCNACGIRQRKARRALMAEGGGNPNYSRVNSKEKKGSRGNHFVQFKNKWKGTTSQGSDRRNNVNINNNNNNNGFKDFGFGFSSNGNGNGNGSAVDHQVFPRDDVAEAALLLMDLSCAFLPI
ncbi:putative GATA transcription factor 22 [Senna tora]|uniref:Putative GATA transcription factor 22 n=1 Tax=Senna tora TaxID=362788 RepID=A0A834U1S1_9FABA|nr:putative GATA transcription factor 22 [Senna tora]